MNVSGNTILLTGGTSGIGLEMLRQFHSLNNRMIVVSGTVDNLASIKKQFQGIETIPCDLADSSSVHKLMEICRKQYIDINVIINNAGVQYNYSWLDEKQGQKKIMDEIAINLSSPVCLTYGLLPLLLMKKSAAIINVSSGLLYAPKKSAPVYCGTKAAMHSITKAIRYQLENTAIKVFEIIPAMVSTPMTAGRGKGKISPKQLVDEFMKNFRNDILESNIGKVKLLKIVQRLSPFLADSIMKNG